MLRVHRLVRPAIASMQLSASGRRHRLLSTAPPQELSDTLRQEVKMLGSMLGGVIQKHAGEQVFQDVEEMRTLAREWRSNENDETALDGLCKKVNSLSAEEMKQVSKAFAHFLALANAAESNQRVRSLRQGVLDDKTHALPMRKDSTLGTITSLLESGKSKEDIYNALITQRVELVMTAHPTEVNRRTLLHKHKEVSENLAKLFLGREWLTSFEKEEIQMQVMRAVESIWNSDEVRRVKPSPLDEARAGIAIIEQVLWNAIPSWLRKLDDTVRRHLGKSLPADCAPVVMASWMGGDRDGNPNVTPEITLEASFTSRWQATSLLLADVKELRMELSMTKASQELANAAGNVREPYREVLKTLQHDLEATVQLIRSMLAGDIPYSVEDLPIQKKEDVLGPLRLLHRSLVETNQASMADGMLTDVIRKVACFGLVLSPLDIRQESTRHAEALDAITRWLGVGSYAQWDEDTKQTWLLTELNSKRPLLPHRSHNAPAHANVFSPTVIDTLETFNSIASLGPECLGAYVISMATAPSDVLAVKLLMKEHGVGWNMRVVPLFETLKDLTGSASTMEALWSLPWYRGNINGEQEIMIGYSDSAKDAGRMAAAWSQYEAQERLAALANNYGVKLTFFHGKGGTVSRGGNPALFEAIVAQAPDTVNGRFRVTEQGEMLTQNFGSVGIAERTLDIYTAGVLYDSLTKRGPPKEEWRKMMARLSESSCAVYRGVVREDERFLKYFQAATPNLELGALNIGSRPAKRRPGGVETLRAIPWVFAWTQTRLNLPAWLGVGEALNEASADSKATLDDMFQNWPFFRSNIELWEMVMAKAEPRIASLYDNLLVEDPKSSALGKELRDRYQGTVEAILNISGNRVLIQKNSLLQWQLMLRNPYVDPLNVLQATILKKLRFGEYANEEEKEALQDALVITINGISAGMRNTG